MKYIDHFCKKVKKIFLFKNEDSSNHQFNINDKFNISKYDIEVKYKIGEGEYGNVYRGNFYDQTGKCVSNSKIKVEYLLYIIILTIDTRCNKTVKTSRKAKRFSKRVQNNVNA